MQVRLAPGQTDISERPDLAALQTELEEATADHKAAAQATMRALSVETAALNRLNAAQKKIDEAIKVLRLTAPRSSEWQSRPGYQAEKSA